VPRAPRSSSQKRKLSALSGLRATPAAAPLAPTKALKSGASSTPRTVAQSPTGGPQTAETVARYRDTIARGDTAAQVQEDTSDAGRSSVADAARPGVEGEADRGSMEGAARSDAGEDAGRGGAEHATRPDVEEGGETGRDASEHLASQVEGEVFAPEPARAGNEEAAAAAMA